MKHFFLLISAGALLASPSVAQSGPVAQQSSDQLVCQLTGDCDGAAAATQEKGRTRGFSIARPGQKPQVQSATAPTMQRPSMAPSPRVYSKPSASPRYATPGGRYAAPSSAMPAGRADLLITFVTGSAILTEQAKSNANVFVSALNNPKLASMRFAIEGHTDAVGSRPYNLDLSQRRAQAVVDYLTAHGVNRAKFEVKGYGFDRPINSRNPKAAANRRVEVVKAN
jgi:OmpA-OmpF porin, OOP family